MALSKKDGINFDKGVFSIKDYSLESVKKGIKTLDEINSILTKIEVRTQFLEKIGEKGKPLESFEGLYYGEMVDYFQRRTGMIEISKSVVEL